MDVEQAERFVAAAERDYWMAVGWYCVMVEGKAEGPEEIVQPRADVLAAQQVLLLARQELGLAVRRADQAAAAEVERVMREEEAALRAHDDVIRERRRREREDRTALDRAAEERQS